MSLNEGALNEERMILAINDKKFEELNPNLQTFIMQLFPELDKSKRLSCCHAEEYTKPDIVISQGPKRRYVSLKTGTSDTMHNEKIEPFIDFLKENGFDDYTIESFLLYHYGDGTTDGSGETRLGVFDVRKKYDERIRALNDAFNRSKDFIKKFADRVMFQGVNPLAMPADVIYHGNEEFGLYMSKYQFMRHVERKTWSYMEFSVHVGPFVIRPKARYPGREIKNDENRRIVVVNYPRIMNDIPWIRNRYLF
jgi:hypothetical protein